MREQLKIQQPIFYHLIQNEFKQSKVPHAYLLVGDNTKDALTFLTMSLICTEDTLACENCIDCNKIKNNIYSDLISFDGNIETIKKGNVEFIQEQFKKTAVEGKSKIYILENIENATKEAMNSLLKILEEPIPGIYAIFTTKNINRVLPTIQSRCQVIDIKPLNKLELKKELIRDGINEEDANILIKLVSNIDDAKALYDDRFEYMKLQVINFIEDMFFKKDNLVINTHTNLLKNYKAKEDIRLFLNILAIAMKDVFHVKHYQQISFTSQKDFFSTIQVDNNVIIDKIELILEANYKMDSNANIALLIDSLMYKL